MPILRGGETGARHARCAAHLQGRIDRDSGCPRRLLPRLRGKRSGGGANAFSRQENGKTKPPLALVKLLMVLDRHPNLLDEVRARR